MTKKENSIYNMFLAVQLECDNSILVWQNQQVYSDAYDQFKANNANIEVALQNQQAATTGYSQDKTNRKLTMADLAMIVKGTLQAFATDKNDSALYENVNFSVTDIVNSRATLAEARCQKICDAASANLASMANYGLTQAMIDGLTTAIKKFDVLIAMPRDVRSTIATATQDIKKLVKANQEILKKKLDKLMGLFEETAPAFYSNYFNNRKIVDGKTNYTELRATILNKNTHLPIAGATITAVSGKGTLVITTDAAGVADEKKISPDTYDITIEVAGFVTQTCKQVKIGAGDLEKLNVEMVPVI
ncbi:MAG: carboxypeptidase-like regulatory domain-containing protein [Bacteroidetes bacterium]|nr:carboxypeptidase-like regulatory domain-containing protein [Bacteroidota bacterium]